MCRASGEGSIAERVDDFRLVGLSASGTGRYLRGVNLNLVSTNYCGDDEAREVFAREPSLDVACTVVNDEVLLLVEENLHLLQAVLNGSHLIQILFNLEELIFFYKSHSMIKCLARRFFNKQVP